MIKSKDQALLNYALEHKFDAIIIIEIWLKDNNDIWKSATCLNRNGYYLLYSDRPEMKQGGGIGLMFRSDLKVKVLEKGCRNTFKYSVWQIRLKGKDQKNQTFQGSHNFWKSGKLGKIIRCFSSQGKVGNFKILLKIREK